ncbi:MAG: hypothetical protein NTX71_10170 [Candidatus Aureabacteria bacterium]|nr:hypothetical protein [Candidatus Auribacterota bacterium]
MIDILWKYYRNGIAHGFVIDSKGGIEISDTDGDRRKEPYRVENRYLKVDPIHLFNDLKQVIRCYFVDLKAGKYFLKNHFCVRFSEVYPHGNGVG